MSQGSAEGVCGGTDKRPWRSCSPHVHRDAAHEWTGQRRSESVIRHGSRGALRLEARVQTRAGAEEAGGDRGEEGRRARGREGTMMRIALHHAGARVACVSGTRGESGLASFSGG